MKYQKANPATGAWVNKKELVSGTKYKIVSEATNQPSNFKDKNGKDRKSVV
jgi:hypothetical protein